MQNDAGQNVDLYIPRKWCDHPRASSRAKQNVRTPYQAVSSPSFAASTHDSIPGSPVPLYVQLVD